MPSDSFLYLILGAPVPFGPETTPVAIVRARTPAEALTFAPEEDATFTAMRVCPVPSAPPGLITEVTYLQCPAETAILALWRALPRCTRCEGAGSVAGWLDPCDACAGSGKAVTSEPLARDAAAAVRLTLLQGS